MTTTRFQSSTWFAICATIAAFQAAACTATDRSEHASPGPPAVTQQALRENRPPLAEFLTADRQKRLPRPAPAPVGADAARKLADFELQVAERKAAWNRLPAPARERSRAELKHALLNSEPVLSKSLATKRGLR
jgi:hypothetical protein